jgi:hypothetical protein
MSTYKVVRDAQNAVVCFGPNTDNYAPRIPEGCTMGLEEDLPELPAAPDGPAFIRAVQADVFGNDLDRIDEVWGHCPLWWPAAKEANWPLVEAYTIRARQREYITQEEYDGIKAAAVAHRIPVTL